MFSGAKKKHRKEMMALKRRERMLHRGVDLQKINSVRAWNRLRCSESSLLLLLFSKSLKLFKTAWSFELLSLDASFSLFDFFFCSTKFISVRNIVVWKMISSISFFLIKELGISVLGSLVCLGWHICPQVCIFVLCLCWFCFYSWSWSWNQVISESGCTADSCITKVYCKYLLMGGL